MAIVPASREDRAHLAHAIRLAAAGHGATSPNPAVGCVIVRDGLVVGSGATRPAGGAHAEVVALAEAGAAARGATAYVTLEPCAHHGRTPPCADALVAAGVARVVIGHRDPHPLATGGGDRLRAHGIPVDEIAGPLHEAVAAMLEGFLTHAATGRPHVTLKLAQTATGATVAPAGVTWITGPAARLAVHRWRRQVDVVLVGSGTVLADDPRLDVRDVPLGDRPQPRPIVLDARLRTPAAARVIARGALIVTTAGAPAAARTALAAAGAEVVDVPGAAGGGVDLHAALRAIGRRGITSLLAEPGRTLASALLEADLVDRLVLHVAPASLGDAAGFTPAVTLPDRSTWSLERDGLAGDDRVLQYLRARRSATEGA